MANIVRAEIIDGILRTTYSDDKMTEMIVPKGHKMQVRLVKQVIRKDVLHYYYAKCNMKTRAVVPDMTYLLDDVTCKNCLQAIKNESWG